MTIRTKVMGCFLLILALFMGVSAYSYSRSQAANRRLALVNELFLPLSRQVAQLQTNIQGLAEDVRRFYFQLDQNPENSTFSRMVRDLYPYLIHKKFSVIEGLLSKQEDSEHRATVVELAQLLSRARALFDELSKASDRTRFEATLQSLRAQLQAVSKRVDDECQNITLAAQKEGRENLISSLSLSLIMMLFGILILMFSQRVLSPLPGLISSIKKNAEGDFHQSLKVKTSDKDEIALLAREYNRMMAALSERDKKIHGQQKELLQAERLAAVGQLSAEVVHEIRNPLNSISLNIDWLENELSGSQTEVARTLSSISREIERLHQITESYLVRARVSPLESPKTPVHELLEEILEFAAEEDRASQISVEKDLFPQEIYVRGERSRLKQAFLNVIKNAKEAMPRGGQLTIRTLVQDNVSRIQVGDSGYGMNEVTRSQTFQPFFTTKPNGTGLGLVVTKSIVEEANGSLLCESSVGRGTTFTFQFPV